MSPPLRRRLSKRLWLRAGVAVLLAGLVVADHQGWLLVRHVDDMSTYHGRSVVVTRVIDGDTIEVDWPDATTDRPQTRIRLWGIDAPEVEQTARRPDPFAVAARALARELVEGETVRLHLERDRTRGLYGRLLAHVELPDGHMLNRRLLLAGLARADDRWGHGRLTHYAQAELIARRAGLGLWADGL